MKNQNDIIISIVAIVLALIIGGVCLGTKREPIAPAAPEVVNLAKPALPAGQGDVVMANSLPGAGSSGGPGGSFGGPAAMGGPAGLAGPAAMGPSGAGANGQTMGAKGGRMGGPAMSGPSSK